MLKMRQGNWWTKAPRQNIFIEKQLQTWRWQPLETSQALIIYFNSLHILTLNPENDVLGPSVIHIRVPNTALKSRLPCNSL